MLSRAGLLATAAVMLLASPVALLGQETAEPQNHYLTVTTFTVPLGPAGQDVMMWVDSVMVPLARLNPNVLSLHVGRHQWGSDSGHIIMISEYGSWEAIEADCGQPCEEWSAANQPQEGTPRAEKWQKIQENFLKYYTGHDDEIYIVPSSRRK